MGGRTRGVWTEGSGLEYGCGTVARTGADGAQAIRAARDPGLGPSHHAEKNRPSKSTLIQKNRVRKISPTPDHVDPV